MSRKVFQRLNEERAAKEEAPVGQSPQRRRRFPAAAGPQDRRPAPSGHASFLTSSSAEGETIPAPMRETAGLFRKAPASRSFPALCCPTLLEVQAEIDRLGTGALRTFPIEMDGAVVKVNDLSQRDLLGSTAKFPRWAVAWKYPPEQKPAKVLDIVVQVGRTGVLTPKAVAGTGAAGGHHRHQRHPPQPGFHHRKGCAHRGHRPGPKGRGDHSRRWSAWTLRKRPAGRRALSPAGGLPRLRRSGGAGRGRRGRCAAPERSVPRSCCATWPTSPAAIAMDIEGLGPAVVRGAGGRTSLITHTGRSVPPERPGRGQAGSDGGEVGGKPDRRHRKVQTAGSVPPHQRLRHPSGGYPWRPGAGGAVPHSGCAHGSGRGGR